MHPAVFASADGEGRMDLWNINMDTEVRGGGRGGGVKSALDGSTGADSLREP